MTTQMDDRLTEKQIRIRIPKEYHRSLDWCLTTA